MNHYGTFEGRDNKTYDPLDPIDVTLGLCRMLGLYYEIKRSIYGENKWTISLSIYDWPADFYSKTPPMSMTRMTTVLIVVGSSEDQILHHIHCCISSAFGSLRDSCSHWRRIAGSHPDYKCWPQFRDPQEPA
jgi:hypothetical protein